MITIPPSVLQESEGKEKSPQISFFFSINLGNPPKQAGKGSFEMRPSWTQICADAMDQKNAIFFSLRSDRAQFCRNLFSGGVKIVWLESFLVLLNCAY